jgi:hypothetical protein
VVKDIPIVNGSSNSTHDAAVRPTPH